MDINILALIIGAVGMASSVYACYFAKISYKLSSKVARTSGALEMPIAYLAIGKIKLKDMSITQLLFGLSRNDDDKAKTIAYLPCSLINAGNKNIENVAVIFRTSKFWGRLKMSGLELSVKGVPSIAKLNIHYGDDTQFDYVNYCFESINPSVKLSFCEPFNAINTETHLKIPVKTKDNVNLTASTTVCWGRNVLITVSKKDAIPKNYFLTLDVITAFSMTELVKYATSEIIPKARKNFRKKFKLIEYLSCLIFQKKEQDLFVIQSDTIKHVVNCSQNLYEASQSPDMAYICYDLLSWRYLFFKDN